MRRIGALPQACAAPVFGVAQVLHGALNLSGLREHFTLKYISMLRRHLLTAAAELTQSLGSPDGSPLCERPQIARPDGNR